MKKAWSMEFATPTSKFTSKGTFSSRHNKKFPKKEDKAKDKSTFLLDRETLNDLRKKKLCFYCKGPCDINYDCPMKPKGKSNRAMWALIEDFDSDQQSEINDLESEKTEHDEELEEEVKLKEARLTSIQREGSFRMRGVLAGQKIITLLDTGATHNFIDTRLVERRGIHTEKFEGI